MNDVLKPTTYSPKDLGTTAAGNLTRDGTLMLYAPNNNLVNGLMEKINLTLNTDGLKGTYCFVIVYGQINVYLYM